MIARSLTLLAAALLALAACSHVPKNDPKDAPRLYGTMDR